METSRLNSRLSDFRGQMLNHVERVEKWGEIQKALIRQYKLFTKHGSVGPVKYRVYLCQRFIILDYSSVFILSFRATFAWFNTGSILSYINVKKVFPEKINSSTRMYCLCCSRK